MTLIGKKVNCLICGIEFVCSNGHQKYCGSKACLKEVKRRDNIKNKDKRNAQRRLLRALRRDELESFESDPNLELTPELAAYKAKHESESLAKQREKDQQQRDFIAQYGYTDKVLKIKIK